MRRTPGMRKQLRLRKRQREQELDFLAMLQEEVSDAREDVSILQTRFDARCDKIERAQSILIRAVYMTANRCENEAGVKTFLFENGLL